MNIVILDGYTLNPGDLSWETLNAFGNVKIYDRTPASQVVERSNEAAIILTNKVPVTADMLKQLPKLQYIGVMATGYNIVDTEAAKKQGVVVTNVPGYSTYSVVQLTFALLLEFTHHVQRHSDVVQQGKWSGQADFSFHDFPLIELAGKTMGLVGFGAIGKQVAIVAKALGMQVIVHRKHSPENAPDDLRYVTLEELLRTSDVVSLHCPLTAETKELINEESLRNMKAGCFLINTARGPLIDEPALAKALKEGRLAGAGLDVLSSEPPASDNPLLAAPNCFITPHIAWASKEARQRLMKGLGDNLKAYLAGKSLNQVNE